MRYKGRMTNKNRIRTGSRGRDEASGAIARYRAISSEQKIGPARFGSLWLALARLVKGSFKRASYFILLREPIQLDLRWMWRVGFRRLPPPSAAFRRLAPLAAACRRLAAGVRPILLLRTALALFAGPILCQSAATAWAAEVIYENPVIPGDHPDPSIIRVGKDYWATSTSSEWGPQFPLLHSTDLVNWEQKGVVFDHRPEWAVGNFWAPEISQYK